MKQLQRVTAAGARYFPTTEQLLVMGGDARIELHGGMNQYGCRPLPDPGLLAFGSSTASVISQAGFAAAEKLRKRLLQETDSDAPDAVYALEMQSIRQELLQLCGVSDVDLVFATSGTDVHFIVAQHILSGADRPVRVVMVEEDETGSGVVAALTGKNFVPPDDSFIKQGGKTEVVSVPLRLADGTPRPLAEIDAGMTALVDEAVKNGRRVLLVMVDQSKTGMIAPSQDCVAQLLHHNSNYVDVLVDACQFRLAPVTLTAYLQQGFMVALTGSKFLTGPSFSAALLIPAPRKPRGSPYATWDADRRMEDDSGMANFGLLLRWEAAMAELRRFHAVPQADATNFLQAFAQAVTQRLMNDARFEPLAVPPLDRRPLTGTKGWDQLPTIFPFLLYHADAAGGRVPLNRCETLHIYRLLQVDLSPLTGPDGIASLRCQLGQPVACGMRHGIAVSALRLCISARQISDAMGEKGISGVINDALASLNKTAWLVDRIKE